MNRRTRARFKTDLTARVTCLDFADGSLKARVADLSAHGLSVIIGKELPVGSRVKVEWGQASFEGELVYCRSYGKEFMAGLKIEDTVYSVPASRVQKH